MTNQHPSKVKLKDAVEAFEKALNEASKSDPTVNKLFNVEEVRRAAMMMRSEVA